RSRSANDRHPDRLLTHSVVGRPRLDRYAIGRQAGRTRPLLYDGKNSVRAEGEVGCRDLPLLLTGDVIDHARWLRLMLATLWLRCIALSINCSLCSRFVFCRIWRSLGAGVSGGILNREGSVAIIRRRS